MPGLRAVLLAGLVCGLALGWASAALEGLVVERDWQHGLVRLAAARASHVVGAHALAGLAGFAVAAPIAAIGARRARRGQAATALRAASCLAAALPAAAWFAWNQRWVVNDIAAPRIFAAGMLGLVATAGAAFLVGLLLRGPLDAGRRVALRLAGTAVGLAAPAAALAGFAALAPAGPGVRPDVLLLVMDTVRADRLSSYGYARPTTPELDAFAREAIRYPRFYSTSSWTLPAHASLFTGLPPMQHGATQEHLRLERRFATLAERLRDAGYATFAASANPVVGTISGLEQGFECFDEVWRGAPGGLAPARLVNAALLEFLARAPRDRPFFAFLNYMEAHRPYRPPPERLRRFARRPVSPLRAGRIGDRPWYEYYLDGAPAPEEVELLSDLYDAELSELSAAIGELLAALRRDGRLDDMLVIVTSDHGENLGEHGHFDHAFSLYETTIRVPLLVRLPGGARGGEVDARLGQLVDLVPALLRLGGAAPAREPVSRFDLLDPDRSAARDEVVAEYYFPRQALGMISRESRAAQGERLRPYLRRLRALQRDGRKLIWGSDGRHELYDVASDPDEHRDLLRGGGASGEAAAIEARLEAIVAAQGSEAARAPLPADPGSGFPAEARDQETAESLRALGYVR